MSNSIESLYAYFDTEAAKFSGRFGLAAQPVEGHAPILYNASEIFPTASVIKLAVLAEYLAQVEAGRLAPNQPVTVEADDQVGGSGVLKDLQPGLQLTLQDVATLTITVSDNTAANLLIAQLGGLRPVNERLQAMRMMDTVLGRPFIFDATIDNTGTPADFLKLLLALARHQLVSPAASRQLLAMMRRQQYLAFIPRYLPYHPFAAEYGLPQAISIANKVGMLRGAVNDAAVIFTPAGDYALVIFTRDCRDDRPDADNEAALLLARLSKRIHDFYCSGEADF